MANVKVSALPANTTPVLTDKTVILDDPAGTPVLQAITLKDMMKASRMFSIVGSDFSLSTATGVQSAFPSTGDVWTLAATTAYWMRGVYYIGKSGTTCTIAMAFAGTATLTSILYTTVGAQIAINVAGGAAFTGLYTQAATSVVIPTGTIAAHIKFEGIVRVNAGGTFIPQINFSASPTAPLMKLNSYIQFVPLGTNTDNIFGDAA